MKEGIDKVQRDGWVCAICREICKCKKCKPSNSKRQSSRVRENSLDDVISYKIKGKRAFRVDNFVIIEKDFKFPEEQKVKPSEGTLPVPMKQRNARNNETLRRDKMQMRQTKVPKEEIIEQPNIIQEQIPLYEDEGGLKYLSLVATPNGALGP